MLSIIMAVVFQLDTTAIHEEMESSHKVFYSHNDLKEWILGECAYTSLEDREEIIDMLSVMSDEEYKILLSKLNKSTDIERVEILKQLARHILTKRESTEEKLEEGPIEIIKQDPVPFVQTSANNTSFSYPIILDKQMLLDFAMRIFPDFLSNNIQTRENALSMLGELWIQFGEAHVENTALLLQQNQDYMDQDLMSQLYLLKKQIERI